MTRISSLVLGLGLLAMRTMRRKSLWLDVLPQAVGDAQQEIGIGCSCQTIPRLSTLSPRGHDNLQQDAICQNSIFTGNPPESSGFSVTLLSLSEMFLLLFICYKINQVSLSQEQVKSEFHEIVSAILRFRSWWPIVHECITLASIGRRLVGSTASPSVSMSSACWWALYWPCKQLKLNCIPCMVICSTLAGERDRVWRIVFPKLPVSEIDQLMVFSMRPRAWNARTGAKKNKLFTANNI